MVGCPACGAGMRFDPASQMVKCDHCDTKIVPEDAVTTQYAGEQVVFDSMLYSCPQCGAELVSDDNTAATFCSFCGASVMLQGQAVKMVAPSYVLPFKLAKEKCTEQYKKLIKGAMYAPNYMKSDAQISKLRGIYMPYWNYDFNQSGLTSVTMQKSHRSGDYIVTDHFNVNADMRASYRGFAFDASASFADELSEAIAPFNVRENRPFNAAYLSGFYADTADVNASVYEKQARDMAATDIENELLKRPECRGASVENDAMLKSSVQVSNAEVSYFPVWFMANRHKNNRVSYAVINGQTGKVAADIPIDYTKYIVGSLILALPIILVLNFLFTLKPGMILFCALIFAVMCHIISNNQLNMLFTREHYLNDKGLQSVKGADAAAQMAMMTQNAKNAKPKKAKTFNAGGIFMTIAMLALMIGFPLLDAIGIDAEFAVCMIFVCLFFGSIISMFATAGKNNTKASKTVVSQRSVYKKPFNEKIGVLIKPIIAEILGGLLLLINPAIDTYYYAGIMVIIVLVLLCFWDLVQVHNKLTMRLPQQFGKRGGDEHEGI